MSSDSTPRPPTAQDWQILLENLPRVVPECGGLEQRERYRRLESALEDLVYRAAEQRAVFNRRRDGVFEVGYVDGDWTRLGRSRGLGIAHTAISIPGRPIEVRDSGTKYLANAVRNELRRLARSSVLCLVCPQLALALTWRIKVRTSPGGVVRVVYYPRPTDPEILALDEAGPAYV